MKAIDKPRFVKEARELFSTLNMEKLIKDPNDINETQKINKLIAIFTNFSSNDGDKLRELFFDFRKWARASTRIGHIKNRAADVMQFIGEEIENMDIYKIEDDTSEAVQERKKLSEGKYDVAFSFAGEQRDFVSSVATYIENRSRLKVFYDENEKIEIWGKNLVDYLKEVYEKRASYCVMLISKEYAEKAWPNFERQIIQAKSLYNDGYLLPARFDDTQLKGEVPTIAYINVGSMKPEEFGEIVISKVMGSGRYATREEKHEIVSITPSGEITTSESIPLLYIKPVASSSGGPKGHFVYFVLKNMAKQVLLDISWGIRGFDYEWRDEGIFELEPGVEKEVTYPISSERVFKDQIQELNIISEYRDLDNRRFFVRRELNQVLVLSGAFYELKAAAFWTPTLLRDDGLKVASDLQNPGDRYELEFEIQTKSGVKRSKIGVSRTLLSVWGIIGDSQIKQSLVELGHRKVRSMARIGKIEDYLFTTNDYTTEFQNGYEGYKKLRESIR